MDCFSLKPLKALMAGMVVAMVSLNVFYKAFYCNDDM